MSSAPFSFEPSAKLGEDVRHLAEWILETAVINRVNRHQAPDQFNANFDTIISLGLKPQPSASDDRRLQEELASLFENVGVLTAGWPITQAAHGVHPLYQIWQQARVSGLAYDPSSKTVAFGLLRAVKNVADKFGVPQIDSGKRLDINTMLIRAFSARPEPEPEPVPKAPSRPEPAAEAESDIFSGAYGAWYDAWALVRAPYITAKNGGSNEPTLDSTIPNEALIVPEDDTNRLRLMELIRLQDDEAFTKRCEESWGFNKLLVAFLTATSLGFAGEIMVTHASKWLSINNPDIENASWAIADAIENVVTKDSDLRLDMSDTQIARLVEVELRIAQLREAHMYDQGYDGPDQSHGYHL